VTQSGAPPAAPGPSPCTYAINPTSQSMGQAAATGTVSVTSAGGCSWTAASNASWITITSGSTGSGNGTVGFSVAANSGGTRTGTLTIAGATFSLTQGAACAYQINPNNQSIGATGGPGTQVAVSTTSGCTWTATSNASWITVTSGASGSGNGNVNFNVAPNTGSSTRTGTLTIAGQTFTVSQDRLVCTYDISPNNESFEEQGGNGEPIAVSASPGCAWTATSSVPWITITSGLSGVGNGTVRFRVDRNHGNQRTGTMIIAGKTFTVTQEEDED
jgi:Putative binding domain, N-terminal